MDNTLLWDQYFTGKQTYWQPATGYGCSVKTIQRRLDAVRPVPQTTFPARVNVVMDTTYFGRSFGVMAFKDAISGQMLLKRYVQTETTALYVSGIEEIARRGIYIQAIVCDGRKGVIQRFGAEGIPVQMCQFHQVAIIRRYLTKKPKMQAGKELWALAMLLARTDKESFVGSLHAWHATWELFLKERSTGADGRSHYTHRKLRSAYRSLKTNLPYLFTWYDHLGYQIPNTTNALDGAFSDLKNKLRSHNGLSEQRKKRFIDEFFKA